MTTQHWIAMLETTTTRSIATVGAVMIALCSAAKGDLPPPQVTLTPVFTSGYAASTINSVAPNRNNLVTFGNQQFIAFYDSNTVRLGRRNLGEATWQVFDTLLAPANINNDHCTVGIALDGDGHMHMSWGMHNNPLNYVVSDAPVTGSGTWSRTAVTFTTKAPLVDAGTESRVTYPEFYPIPGSKDLLFIYRQGGSGGGSGNGDHYFVRYDAAAKTWAKNLVVQGTADSVNAYPNRLVYDSNSNLLFSWTWRDTPQFQTNHNIMFARSPDNGLSWTSHSGNPYTLPITKPQAQVIANIPQQSTLINQTSMTLDSHDRPLIATWYAPLAAQGDHTRQYMLHWFDGDQWKVSQLTNRPNEPKQSDSTVRELGRPIVLCDRDDRVLVVMRYKETGNNIVVAVSEDRENWQYITLAAQNMGIYEPTYDAALWQRENKLHLFYQTMGLGVATSPVSILEWDAKAYFQAVPEPSGAALLIPSAGLLIRRPRTTR